VSSLTEYRINLEGLHLVRFEVLVEVTHENNVHTKYNSFSVHSYLKNSFQINKDLHYSSKD